MRQLALKTYQSSAWGWIPIDSLKLSTKIVSLERHMLFRCFLLLCCSVEMLQPRLIQKEFHKPKEHTNEQYTPRSIMQKYPSIRKKQKPVLRQLFSHEIWIVWGGSNDKFVFFYFKEKFYVLSQWNDNTFKRRYNLEVGQRINLNKITKSPPQSKIDKNFYQKKLYCWCFRDFCVLAFSSNSKRGWIFIVEAKFD